jgi:hypothetical protein
VGFCQQYAIVSFVGLHGARKLGGCPDGFFSFGYSACSVCGGVEGLFALRPSLRASRLAMRLRRALRAWLYCRPRGSRCVGWLGRWCSSRGYRDAVLQTGADGGDTEGESIGALLCRSVSMSDTPPASMKDSERG